MELTRQRLWGFLIPHADEYLNEYLPASAERLAWLTGFTGWAGMAVVLQDTGAIFVDGRYVLQVKNQVDLNIFVPRHLTDHPVDQWLASVLQPGQRLGYDPWLHTPHEVEKFQQACDRAHAELVACEMNPVDVIWADRPAYPMAPVVSHPVSFTGKESIEKRKELSGSLREAQVEAAVLTAPDSIAWLLNIRGGDVAHTPLPLCRAILSVDGRVDVYIHSQKVGHDLPSHFDSGVRLYSEEAFGQALDALGQRGARVLYDPARSPYWVIDRLGKAKAHLVKGNDPCLLPKACKNQVELQGMRKAHKRDGAAVCRFLAWLDQEAPKGQVTELTAAAYLDECRRRNDYWKDASFPTISAFGSHGAIVHYQSTHRTNQTLQPGSLYLVDSGAQYLDGTTDITRTIAIGRPTVEQKDRYTRVLQGHIALATARFPQGTTGGQLDAFARRFLWNIGLDFDHGTGHGVGSYLGVHEGPQRISKTPTSVALQAGMVLSNEPGYYKAGEYGIRIENLIVVVPCSDQSNESQEWLAFETLTMVPFDRNLIDVSLLAECEREWMNTYHRGICQALTPLVDHDVQVWLEAATEPV